MPLSVFTVHYAGTDRRLDEWVDTERVELSSARSSLFSGLSEKHLVDRDAADQKFSEILQKSEKHMVLRSFTARICFAW